MALRAGTIRGAVHPRRAGWLRNFRHDWPIHLFMGIGLFFSGVPILFMLLMSLKSQGQFLTRPLAITFPLHWDNYVIAFNVLKRSILNSIVLVAINVLGSLSLAALAAYIFARFRFPGRELLFWLILGIIFVPGILTFAPSFVIVSQLKLVDTFWVLILPTIAGAQIFAIFVLRSFFAGISEEILDAARVDGAGIIVVFWRIVLPMSRPILAALAIIRAVDVWNEWLWPLVTIQKYELRPMALQVFYLSSDMGAHVGRQMAGYAIATIPLLILFVLFTRQFVEGLSAGAIKW